MLLNQGNSYNANLTDCLGIIQCNWNYVLMDDDPAYYGYVNFFLLMLAIVVACPLLGWGWSKLTRDKNYHPGGGYGVAGV